MPAYREPATIPFDGTELEIAKLKETSATTLKLAEMRHEAKAEARKQWIEWYNRSDAAGVVLWASALIVLGTLSALVILYAVHAWWRCR